MIKKNNKKKKEFGNKNQKPFSRVYNENSNWTEILRRWTWAAQPRPAASAEVSNFAESWLLEEVGQPINTSSSSSLRPHSVCDRCSLASKTTSETLKFIAFNWKLVWQHQFHSGGLLKKVSKKIKLCHHCSHGGDGNSGFKTSFL